MAELGVSHQSRQYAFQRVIEDSPCPGDGRVTALQKLSIKKFVTKFEMENMTELPVAYVDRDVGGGGGHYPQATEKMLTRRIGTYK